MSLRRSTLLGRSLLVLTAALSTRAGAQSLPFRFDSTTSFAAVNGRVMWVMHDGKAAVHLVPLAGHEHDTDQEMMAVLTGSDFHDGVIEVEVAGSRRQGYSTAGDSTGYKGMIGITFRLHGDSAERFYIRPHNARLQDQLFRNRATQYESSPDYPWNRLRQESPWAYESYVDLDAGAWTKLRIEVNGPRARLFVNGATEPCLIVNDLKLGDSHGEIALWSRISTDGYFSNLRVDTSTKHFLVGSPSLTAQAGTARDASLPKITEVVNGRVERVTYRGRPALKLEPVPSTREDMLAILGGDEFKDGTIEVDVAGAPRAGMSPDARGFIGVSFRTGPHAEWSEVLYIRPTNGRAEDQLRRNHSVQYVSEPEYPWYRLRQESPGVYESYADMESGAWTHLRIVVAGTSARLYVNGSSQPVLVVNDLKHGNVAGRIALWANVQTDAYFGPVVVRGR